MVLKILNRFENDKKILYKNGWIGIKNFIKHQKLNPNIEKGIKMSLEKAPNNFKKWIKEKPSQAFLSLSKPSNYLNLNSNNNLNLNSNNNLNINKNIIYECKYFKINKEQHSIYKDIYIYINILTEYKNIFAWRISNPNKKYKTELGMINSWLKRSNDKAKENKKNEVVYKKL